MVQVPVTPGRRVQVQEAPRERFRYAESRNFMGEALQQASAAMGRAADDWDKVEATYDEADALNLDNMGAETVSEIKSEFTNLKGDAPARVIAERVEALQRRREELLEGARSERARRMAARALDVRIRNAREAMQAHADKEMFGFKDSALTSSITQATADAIDARGSENFAVFTGAAIQRLEQRAALNGWSPEQLASEKQTLVDNIFSGAVYAIDAEDGEPTAALAFIDANKDMISPFMEGKLRDSLKPRVLGARFDEVVNSGALDSFLPTSATGGAQSDTPASAGEPIALAEPFAGQAVTVPGGRYGAARSYGGHSGVDYAGLPAGTPVPPSAAGTVTFAGQKGGYGYRVEVDHGVDAQGRRITSTYSHLDGVKVKKGDAVDGASVLGSVGSSGGNYGTHLHWEVLVDGKKVDPATVASLRVQPGQGGIAADPRLNSQNMRAAARAYAAANNLSEEETQALYAAADRAVAQGRQDRAQSEQDADRLVMDYMNKNFADADSFTSMAQLPASMRDSGMSPTMFASLQARAQNASDRLQAARDAEAARRVRERETQAAIELTLTDQELLETDLSRYVGIADPKLLANKMKRQRELRQSGASVVKGDTILTIADEIATVVGIDRREEPGEYAKITAAVEREVAGMDPKTLDKNGRRGVVAVLTEKVVTEDDNGWLWDSTSYRYEMAPGTRYNRAKESGAIPAKARAELERRFPGTSADFKFREFQRAREMGLPWAFED